MNEESIFAAAIAKKTPEERAAYLAETCQGDAALRAQVEELLAASNAAGSFFEHPPAGLDVTVDAAAHDTHKPAGWNGSLTFLSPCDKPDRIGKLVGNAGEYEIIEVVGSGGMGIVLRAFDTKLSRVVAVKVLAPELARNPTAVKRFLREAKAAAAVVHDHVVTIHNVEETHQPPFLVMQYVDGQTLQQKIDRAGALELKEILRIGCQMAAGLAAAHKHGLVHRDVKPANILLENGVERVKITDFGLARAADDVEITQQGLIAGTPQYMSPEQARGEPLDARSDLFSLGSVLYTMCTGRPAFRAETTMGVIRRVCDDAPRPIGEVNPELPPWLESIVHKLLSKNPDERFQTAADTSELFAQCLAHVQNPDSAPLPPQVTPFATLPAKDTKALAMPVERKRKAPAALLVVLLGIGLAFSVLAAMGIASMFAWYFHAAGGVETATLTLLVARPTVEVTLNRESVAVTDEGKATVSVPPGTYHIQTIVRGVPARTDITTLRAGGQEVRTIRDDAGAVYIDGPLSSEEVLRRLEEMNPPLTAEWTALFNGKDLVGWKAIPTQHWKADNGVIRGSGPDAFLVSDRVFGDFHLLVEFRINEAGDAGVHFRIPPPEQTSGGQWGHRITGLEAEIGIRKPPGFRTGALTVKDPSTRVLSAAPPSSHKAGEWTRMEIIAQGDRIRILVNGKQVTDYTDPERRFRQGHIALASWENADIDTAVEFRKVEIRSATAAPSSAVSERYVPLPLQVHGNERVSRRYPDLATGKLTYGQVPFDIGPKLIHLSGDGAGEEYPPSARGIAVNQRAARLHVLHATQAGAARDMPVAVYQVNFADGTREDWTVVHGRDVDGYLFAEGTRVNNPAGQRVAYSGQRKLAGDRVRPVRLYYGSWDNPHPEKPIAAIDFQSLGSPAAPFCVALTVEAPSLPAESGQPWLPLFNGQDLAGWKKVPDQPGGWFVEEGVLIGRGKPASGRRDGESAPLLASLRGDYEDFHLRAEMMFDEKADGSIYFRATMPPGQERKGQPDDPTGYQIQFADGKLGCLAGLSTEYQEVKPGDWFTLEIIAQEKSLTVKVNGKATAEVQDAAHQRGHFAIWPLDPDGVVKFRALEIKELPAAPQSGEWQPLFNRLDLAGWKPDPDQRGNWRVEEGILIGGGPSAGGLLRTERSDYEDFHLRAEVLLDSAEADGGIFFRALPQLANECNFSFDPQQPAQQTGSLVVHKPDTKNSVWTSAPAGMAKPKEWMTVEVVVRGGLALTKVNGKTAAASNELCGNPRGHIMLQHFGPRTVVRFRKIEIREMPPADAVAAKPAEEAKERKAVMWGPARDGWQVGIGLKDGKQHYAAGEQVEFELMVRNATDAEKTIRIAEPSDWDLWYSGAEELSVRIFGRDEQDVKLAPRETKTIDVPKPRIDLAGLSGGTYRLKVTTDVGDKKQQPADDSFSFVYDGPVEPPFAAPAEPLKHPDEKYAQVAWGQPILGLSLGIAAREAAADSPREVEFLLWNTDSKPASVSYIQPHALDWQPMLRDTDGKEYHIEPILTGPKTEARADLDPGQVISLGITTLKGPWLSDRVPVGDLAGAYQVWSHFNCRRLDFGQLNLRITSGEAKVEMK